MLIGILVPIRIRYLKNNTKLDTPTLFLCYKLEVVVKLNIYTTTQLFTLLLEKSWRFYNWKGLYNSFCYVYLFHVIQQLYNSFRYADLFQYRSCINNFRNNILLGMQSFILNDLHYSFLEFVHHNTRMTLCFQRK